jgi:hypothetical protein
VNCRVRFDAIGRGWGHDVLCNKVSEVFGQDGGHKVLNMFLFATEVHHGASAEVESGLGPPVVVAEGSGKKNQHRLICESMFPFIYLYIYFNFSLEIET